MQNIVVVGFGAMGQMHTQCYDLIAGATVVGIVDAHANVATKRLKKMGLSIPVFPSLVEAFNQTNCTVVDVCLPTDLHVPVGLEAVAAGKHVFCEKPFAPNVEEAQKLIDAAKRKRVFLMVGHCIRFWPEYQHLTEAFKEKKYGKLLSLSMQRRCSRPVYSNSNWLQNGKRSGGAVMDLHIHDTDYILHLLGTPSAVTSVGTYDFAGWSHVFTTYHFKNVAVHAEGGWNYPSKFGFNMAWQALFEKAALEFDFSQTPKLRIVEGDKAVKPVKLKTPRKQGVGTLTGNISDLGGYLNELTYWVDCLEKKQAPKISTGPQAAESLRVIHAELASLESGQTVSLK